MEANKAKYKKIIEANGKVLYLTGNAGTGKSAYIKKIAEELNLQLIDLRLSEIDSVDVIGAPRVKKMNTKENGEVETMYYAIPEWAIMANEKPTLVFFDELNRAPLETRNAALKILLDKQIGYNFKFNKNVFFAAAGNLGTEDGCDVEELDAALSDRLATIKHNLTVPIWKKDYASENVAHYIVSFLENYPSYFNNRVDNEPNFGSPRAYTFLSDFLKKELGDQWNNANEAIPLVQEYGDIFIGSSANKLIRYLQDTAVINLEDILNRFDQVEGMVKKLPRDRINEFTKSLEAMDTESIPDDQFNNIIKFLKLIPDDERIGFLTEKITGGIQTNDKDEFFNSKRVDDLIKNFKEDAKVIFLSEKETN